ncbi:Ribosomal protein l35, partial [Globisporangium splendens]
MALFRSLTRQFKSLAVTPARVAAPAAASAPALRTFPGLANALPSSALSNPFLTNAAGFPQLQVRCKGYKLKTKSAVKKRFTVNCNGLVKRAQANKRHIATKKTRERIRRLGKPVFVEGKIRKNILSMMNK